MSAVCTCAHPVVVPAKDNVGAYCSACGYWWDVRYGSREPGSSPKTEDDLSPAERRVLLPNTSTEEIEAELIRRGLKKRQGQFQAEHGKRMAQQKQKARNRAKRRNK